MTIRVLVNGAAGRMGQIALKAVQYDSELELAGEADQKDNLLSVIRNVSPDVVLDFTTASAVFDNTTTIIDEGVHPVIGTSGLLQKQVEQLQQVCAKKSLGGIIVPNFSISAVLMMKYAQDAARYLPNVEIIELHHDGKEDSPSGTAIKTAEVISENLHAEKQAKKRKETIPGARGAEYKGIPIHAIRLPGLVAHQEVLFGGTDQVLSIRSDLISRKAFIPGICLTCKKVVDLTELKYGLEHIL